MKVKYFKHEHDGKIVCEQYHIFCPGCKEVHAIGKGIHTFNDDMAKPTFAPSLLSTGKQFSDRGNPQSPIVDVRCHSYVQNGFIQFLSDCTHALAGKTVELPEFPEDAPEC